MLSLLSVCIIKKFIKLLLVGVYGNAGLGCAPGTRGPSRMLCCEDWMAAVVALLIFTL